MTTETEHRWTPPKWKPKPALEDKEFALPDTGLDDVPWALALRRLRDSLEYFRGEFMGYQVNQKLEEEAAELAPFLAFSTNNVGDPFFDSNLATHTKPLERAVLNYYARLWHLKPYDEKDLDTAWGYVLSMGSSEGNVYGLLNARDYLSGQVLMHPNSIWLGQEAGGAVPQTFMAQAEPPDTEPPDKKENYYKPVIFFSEDTHYSVSKAAHTLAIPSFGAVGNAQYPTEGNEFEKFKKRGKWPLEVPSTGGGDGPGTIDVDALAGLVDFFAKKGHPILVVLNIGSTFKGAHDDVGLIAERLRPIFKKHGLIDRVVNDEIRNGYWIHVDGALAATYLPFLRKAQRDELEGVALEPKVPQFDFSIPEVCSIVTSGHKWPGSPWPCGVFMTRRSLQLRPPPTPDVIGSPDTTFGGSRNAFSAIVLWDFLAKHSAAEQVALIAECEKRAGDIVKRLKRVDEHLVKIGRDGLMLARTPNSLSVRFRMPSKEIVENFSLAHVPVVASVDEVIDYSHLYVMAHVKDDMVDRLVDALLTKDAFPERAKRKITPSASATPAASSPEPSGAVVHLAMNRGFA
jgi:histidine decarboxylase